MEPQWECAVVVALGAAGLNNVVHLAPVRRRRAVVTTVLVVVGLAGAVWLWASGALTTGVRAAVPWTLAAAAAAGAVVVTTEAVPVLRTVLVDRRIGEMSERAFIVHVLVRIPVLTAFVEEVLFRGVLWQVTVDHTTTPGVVLLTATAFAASHVTVAVHQARRDERPVARWVVVTLAATFAAGVALGVLRAVTGGLWAPAGVHAAVNGVLAVGARRAARRHQR